MENTPTVCQWFAYNPENFQKCPKAEKCEHFSRSSSFSFFSSHSSVQFMPGRVWHWNSQKDGNLHTFLNDGYLKQLIMQINKEKVFFLTYLKIHKYFENKNHILMPPPTAPSGRHCARRRGYVFCCFPICWNAIIIKIIIIFHMFQNQHYHVLK